MTARIFISYRTSDGMDKATALARDLSERFGADQVFLDKDDLRGGSSWRDEVREQLETKPVVLLLLTPQLFAATDHAGALRIADPNDPVRREFGAAIAAGAEVIPLCCDGVDAPPLASDLPPPFDRIGDYTWRRLRAYDWRSDFERIVEDLKASGVQPVGEGSVTSTAAVQKPAGHPRRYVLLGLGVVVLGAAGVYGWRALHPPADAVDPGPIGLPGTWLATIGTDAPFALTLLHKESQIVLTSEPVPVDKRESWAKYRAYWQRLTGDELRSIVYRGQGTVITDPGTPLTIDIGWKIFNGTGDTMIDSGNLHVSAAPDKKSLDGKVWSNGDQAERPIVLRRPH